MELSVLCLLLSFGGAFGVSVSSDVLEEGHSIVKRFAGSEREFASHEVAHVLHEREQGSFHSISRRDLRAVASGESERRIRLDLSSGSSLHLKLKKRSLFGAGTQFYDNTEKGVVKREAPLEDCYASGEVEVDGEYGGVASVALCDGLHGTATSNGVEYYIHPVSNDEEGHRVHVLKRRATENDDDAEARTAAIHNLDQSTERYKRDAVTDETYKTATTIVIEMAVFVDAHYYATLQKIVPGREEEYNLIHMAAVQALYGDKEKIGYDFLIKIKLYMNWIVDPEEYEFKEDLSSNLKSFCLATRDKYKYDMHFLYTGVTKQKGPAVGIAYVGGVCTSARCANIYSISWSRHSLAAHEIGHNLGFGHHGAAKCPKEIKDLGGGFMGGPNTLNFSPCNKWELQSFFSRGKGKCLFEETAIVNTTDKYLNLPAVLPGHNGSPDQQCHMHAGEEYVFYRPFDVIGQGECAVWMCINLNPQSPEYLRVVKKSIITGYPTGFPCGDEMFCSGQGKCTPWDIPTVGWDVNYLREHKEDVSWSEWSDNWSECSSECGTGVQIKRRKCNFKEGLNLSPHCRGPSIKARPCNQNPCADGQTEGGSREARGDELCERFFTNNVTLRVSKGAKYLPKSKQAWVFDSSAKYFASKSCMLTCLRDPKQWNHVDGIYPDGTPCTESDKGPYLRQRFNIMLRCVQGVCMEMSDCPENEKKDVCGECGGDPSRCVTKIIDITYDVPKGNRSIIATLPAGTKSIEIAMKYWDNWGVRLELWNANNEKILGAGGLFKGTRYKEANAVEYAGTKWQYEHAGRIRSSGPIDQEMVVKALRQNSPIKRIDVSYLLPQ